MIWQLQFGPPVVPRRYHDWSKEVKLKFKRPNLTMTKGEHIGNHRHSYLLVAL